MQRESKHYYTIVAGDIKPLIVDFGTLSKMSGQPNPGIVKGELAKGSVIIPNFSEVWARRIIEDDKEQKNSANVTDPKYKGKLEFLPWFDTKGEVIQIRYLSSSRSLDMQYQIQVEKQRVGDEDASLVLDNGLNDFDERSAAMLCQMLRHHTLNEDSPCRNPGLEFEFCEFNTSKVATQSETAKIIAQNTATNLVIGIQNDTKALQIMAEIFNIDPMKQPEIVYSTLLKKAYEDAAEFLLKFQGFKNRVMIDIRNAEEAGLIDLSQKGFIVLYKDSEEVSRIEDVEGKESDKIKYITDHILNPDIFAGVGAIKKLLTAYSEAIA